MTQASPDSINTLETQNNANSSKATSVFKIFRVIDYIANPTSLTPNLKDKLKKNLTYPKACEDIPANTIIGLPLVKNMPETEKAQIIFPFFPHLSMPIKVGEHIFCISDELGQYYYLTRQCSTGKIEDPNETVALRKRQPQLSEKPQPTIAKFDGEDPEKSKTDQCSNPPLILDDNKQLKQLLNLQTVSSFISEAVPRFKTSAGNWSAQGSNNTLIELGVDSTTGKKKEVGAINIVTGRGMSEETAPLTITNKKGNLEVDKNSKPKPAEGNFDFENDASRIFLTMNSDIDDKFKINVTSLDTTGELPLNTSYPKLDGADQKILPAIVSKSTNQLMIGRAEGTVRIVHESGSSIVMDENGNVQIQCAQAGQIRIGAADASKEPAVLGDKLKTILNDILTQIQAITVPTAVGPSGPPLNVASFAEIQGKLAEIQSKITKLE